MNPVAPSTTRDTSVALAQGVPAVEGFLPERRSGPKVRELLAKNRTPAHDFSIATQKASGRASDEAAKLRQSVMAQRVPGLVDLMVGLSAANATSSGTSALPVLVPTRSVRFVDGPKGPRKLLEYHHRGRLITRIDLGVTRPSGLTGSSFRVPQRESQHSPLLLRPARFTAMSTSDYYAEDDSLTLEEVADEIALTYALEYEVDLGLIDAEVMYEAAWDEQVVNVNPDTRWGPPKEVEDCRPITSPRMQLFPAVTISGEASAADFECIGKAALAIVTGHGVKSFLRGARDTRAQWLGRYIAGGSIRYAVGAGMVTPAALGIAAAAMGWVLYEAHQSCRINALPQGVPTPSIDRSLQILRLAGLARVGTRERSS
jgi:hypothetical protein